MRQIDKDLGGTYTAAAICHVGASTKGCWRHRDWETAKFLHESLLQRVGGGDCMSDAGLGKTAYTQSF